MGREKRENIEGQRLCVQAPIEGVCVPASARPAGSLLVFVSARRHVGASTESKSRWCVRSTGLDNSSGPE